MMKNPGTRIALIAGIAVLAYLSGCAHFAKRVCPSRCNESALVEPDNPYYYYLKALLNRSDTKAYIENLQEALFRDPDSAYLHLELAKALAEIKRFEEALLHVNRALELYPSNPEGIRFKADLLFVIGKKKEAEALLEKYLQQFPEDEGTLFQLVRALVETKNAEKAIHYLTNYIKDHPQDAYALYMRARVFMKMKKWGEAENDLLKCIKLKKNFSPALNDLARLYEIMGKKSKVPQIIEKLLMTIPGRSDLHTWLAEYYYSKGKYKQALKHLIAIEKLGTRSPLLYKTIGITYYMQGDCSKAVPYLKKSPQEDQVLLYLGTCFAEMKNYTLAEEYLKRVSPENNMVYLNARLQLAEVLAQREQFKEAIQVLTKLKGKYSAPEIYEFLARIYIKMKDYPSATSAVKQGLSLNSSYPSFYFLMGVIEHEKGHFEKSIELMKKVLSLDPKNYPALNYIGYSYAEQGKNLQEAEKLIKEALKLAPDDPAVIDSMGWVYYKKGNYSKAYRYIKKALEKMPDDAVIREHMGDVLVKLGRLKEAVKHYEKSLQLKSDEPGVHERVRKKLEKLRKKLTGKYSY